MSAHPNHGDVLGDNPNYYGGPVELAGDGPPPHPLQSHPINAASNTQAGHPTEHPTRFTPSPLESPNGQFPPPPAGAPSSTDQGEQYYPPPPPGPPPMSQHDQYAHSASSHPSGQDQQYYPPPPPGPPPIQIHPPSISSQARPLSLPPEYNEEGEFGTSVTHVEEAAPGIPPRPEASHFDQGPPPGYSDTAGVGSSVTDEKPPVLPARPAAGESSHFAQTPPAYSDEDGIGASVVDGKPPALPARPAAGQEAHFAPPPLSHEPPLAHEPSHAGPAYDQHHHQPYTPTASTATSAPTAPTGDSATTPQAKSGWGKKLYDWGVKAGVPINKITNKLGSEAFWPTTMDKECDKAARILKSFCKDGFYASPSNHTPPSPGHPTTPGPSGKAKVLIKIPTTAIAKAKGIAIFTTFRTGFQISGAAGSGIVMARLPDGTWSPPSGFLVHTLGAGIMAGLDIYDCVCVLNTPGAVDAFTKPRLSLGGEVAVVAGPVGAGASLETAFNKGVQPVWSYMKSRGFYAGMQADGTVIVQRPDANAAFYGERLPVEKILRGEVGAAQGGADPAGKDGLVVMWPAGGKQLTEVLKAAEGKGADERVMREVGNDPTPGDMAPVEPGHGQGQGHGYGTGAEKAEDMRAGTRFA